MTNKNIEKDAFIDVFNDTDEYPHVEDVANHFDISKAKVSQLANRYRKNGEPVINRRKKDNPTGGAEPTDDETSSITFFVDENLNISVRTKANQERVSQILADNDYIGPEQMNDEFAIHLAFVLMANEVTAQIISEYAGDS